MPTVKVLETVADAETATAVLVARALYQAYNYDYGTEIHDALDKMGLKDYLPASGERYVVNTTRLAGMLPETVEVEVQTGRIPGNNMSTVNPLNKLVGDWAAGLLPDEYTKAEPNPKAVNVNEMAARFGARGTLPPVDGDEPDAVWRDLVTKALHWGDNNTRWGKVCQELEKILTGMGFRAYLPPATGNVTVEWKGIALELGEVRLDRSGRPMLDTVRGHLADLVYRAPQEDFKVIESVPTQAPAPA